MRHFAVLLVLIFLIVPAHAANWIYVTTSAKKAHYHVDATSIKERQTRLSGVIRLAWFKVDHSEDKSVKQRESKHLFHFKCARGEMTLVQFADYDAGGNLIDSGSFSELTGFEAAIPDTVGYTLLSTVCNLDL